MSDFICPKCGKLQGSRREYQSHVASCKGISISMETIEKIARGEPLEGQWGFTCEICGEIQVITEHTNYVFPICNNCKKDLKEIILTKRKENG